MHAPGRDRGRGGRRGGGGLRRGGEVHGHECDVPRRRVRVLEHGVPGLGGPVRRGGDLHGDVGRVPGERLRIGVDQLHGRLAGRRVRQRRRRPLLEGKRVVWGKSADLGGRRLIIRRKVRRGGELGGGAEVG